MGGTLLPPPFTYKIRKVVFDPFPYHCCDNHHSLSKLYPLGSSLLKPIKQNDVLTFANSHVCFHLSNLLYPLGSSLVRPLSPAEFLSSSSSSFSSVHCHCYLHDISPLSNSYPLGSSLPSPAGFFSASSPVIRISSASTLP